MAESLERFAEEEEEQEIRFAESEERVRSESQLSRPQSALELILERLDRCLIE